MCCPRKLIPTNQFGQATRLWLCHCQAIQLRVFHITWFSFWLCFFGWFATANLYPQIKQDLGLSDTDRAIAGGCSVASTVIFRVIIGYLCDKFGPKRSYVVLLLVCALPVAGMAWVQSRTGFIIVSLLIGVLGSAFVITQFHTTAMFAGKVVGTANATSAGWGNFGGGCANFLMPLLYTHFVNQYGLSNSAAWRVCMVIPGAAYLVMSVVYYVFTVDNPPLPHYNPDHGASIYIEMDDINLENKGDTRTSTFKIAASDYRTWILFCVYAGCFGIELTVLRFAVSYLMFQFDLNQSTAGFIILCFSLCNLFARSLGGIVADIASRFSSKSLIGRVYALFIMLLIESIFLILFAFGAHGTWINNLGYTIFTLIMFSLCVQAAEGSTFAIVPFIQPKAIGSVVGIVGGGGNMGAMLFAFAIFTSVPSHISWFWAWLILGIFVFVTSFITLCIRFTEGEIRQANVTMNTRPNTRANTYATF